jgi:DNA-binding CsgD family transcriptional regulator
VQQDDWKQIAMSWTRIGAVPLSKPDDACELMSRIMRRELRARSCWLLVAVAFEERAANRFGEGSGWIPAAVVPDEGFVVDDEIEKEYRHNRLRRDRWVAGLFHDVGKHRAYIRSDILGDDPWSTCETGWLLEQYGIQDRMNAVHALNDSTEVWFVADRWQPEPFDAADRDWLLQFVLGLGPFAARLAMSYGLMPGQERLSPRERETLLLLLEGHSETEIASQLDLAHSTVHQYVVAVFRKLGANSRAELMASWLAVHEPYVECSLHETVRLTAELV